MMRKPGGWQKDSLAAATCPEALSTRFIHDEIVATVRAEIADQREAIELYKKLGYSETAPFGDYTEDPLSVFMEKKIG